MAQERIVSPGVFTREKDSSFLPQGIGEIGAGFIGASVKGRAFAPTVVESWQEYVEKFGPENRNSYLPYAVRNYIKDASRATIVRVLGTGGYTLTSPINVVATGSWGSRSVALLHPSHTVTTTGTTQLFESSALTANASGSFVVTVSGSYATSTDFTDKNGTQYSASIDSSNTNYIGNVFGTSPETSEPVYLYNNFKFDASSSLVTDASTTVNLEFGSSESWDFSDSYLEAYTPYITSQDLGAGVVNLFRIATLSHGQNSNYELKIGIRDVKPAGTIAGSEYGEFTVEVRAVDQGKIINSPWSYEDTDARPLVIESFNVNLDPDSPKYIGKVIGDKYETVNSDGEVIRNGNYDNNSKHIRVELQNDVENKAISSQLVPFGFRALVSPLPSAFTQPTSASFVSAQNFNSAYNSNVYWGFDFGFGSNDNLNYLNMLPDTAVQTTGSNVDFLLSNYTQASDANYPNSTSPYTGSINLTTTQTALKTRKFIVPFQGGHDGWKPNLRKKTGADIEATNTQGFDISSTSADGYTSYKKAIDVLSNPEEFDINMLIIPGVLHQYHSSITNYAINMVEERSDTFYIMDGYDADSNVTTAISTTETVDSNYVATYYPWVKVDDTSTGKPIWMPPSVVMGGVVAYNDKVGEKWFAPAGLNRGGITIARDVRKNLRRRDMNDLYEERINPIVSFPGQGICAWGQKTLQGRPSALDRINVRRLLITAKKFIASSTRYLVFEQNTQQTRNRFLNIVNPYLERIRERQGLYAFRVKMDESNNTPDVIDRNLLVGEIFLQPTRTAEFIVLDFNITPTGATFGE